MGVSWYTIGEDIHNPQQKVGDTIIIDVRDVEHYLQSQR